MKINKILAAGVAATLAVTSLSAVASAEEHPYTWPMGYTVKSASAGVDLLGYINKAYEDVEQADQMLLVIELGNKATINGYQAPKCEVKDPKLTVTGLKETGLDAGGRPVYQTVTRDYTLVKFARQETADIDKPDGHEGQWSIAILKDTEPTYKAGEFAPVYFDKIQEVKVTYTVDMGDETDKDTWNNHLKDKKATIDVGNVYLYDITDNNKNGKAEYGTPVVTYKEGDANYDANLKLLQSESALVGTGAEAVNDQVYVTIKHEDITDAEGNTYTFDAANKAIATMKDADGAAVDVSAGKTAKIGGKTVTFVTAGGTDSVTRRVNSLGQTTAFEIVVDALKITVDGLTDGDIYEIPVTTKTYYTNPKLTDAKGKEIKYTASDVNTIANGENYKIYKKDAAEDGFTVYDITGTKVANGTAAGTDNGAVDANGEQYTAGATADGDAANDNLIHIDGSAKVSVADTAAHILAYATVDGGWSPSVFKYTQPEVDVKWDSTTKFPLLARTTANSVIKRLDVKVLSNTGDYASSTLGWKTDGNQSYKGDNKPDGDNPFQFAGLASQFGDYFNLTKNPGKNGKVIFKFTAKAATADEWVSGGVPSSETGLKNALGTSSFGLFVNYNSSTGQLQTPGVVDSEALTVTFDVSEILEDMGGLTKGNVNDIYYGLNNGIDYGNGNIGYYVEEVTFVYDDAPAAVDANTDDDAADDDAAVVVADDDDDDDVVADDDDDDIAADDDIIEDDDDDDDDSGEIIADDDDDDDDVNNDVDYVDADDDANPGTGVGLAVIPAIVAGAALVVSKKRK